MAFLVSFEDTEMAKAVPDSRKLCSCEVHGETAEQGTSIAVKGFQDQPCDRPCWSPSTEEHLMLRKKDSPSFRRPVLYVEDQPINVLLMSALFEQRPELELVVAASVHDALQFAVGLNPALLLLDIRLPDGDGRDLLPKLRRIAGCEFAPAVAVTAEPDFRLPDSGFAELWRKPLDLLRVLSRIDALAASAWTNTVQVPSFSESGRSPPDSFANAPSAPSVHY
jgi:CheY-like chemotaxis protein